jgi:hypothetical protein
MGWEISTKLGADGIRRIFADSDNLAIRNIEVVHIDPTKIIGAND